MPSVVNTLYCIHGVFILNWSAIWKLHLIAIVLPCKNFGVVIILNAILFIKRNGGGMVVDNTTYGIKRDVTAQVRVAKETGVHVVAGAGTFSWQHNWCNFLTPKDNYLKYLKKIINTLNIV